jgi:hypothetical protein
MASRASIHQCIDYAWLDVGTPTSATEYNNWITNMFTQAGFEGVAVGSATYWNKDSEDERTVFNWIIPSLRFQRFQNEVPLLDTSVANDRISLVVQVLKAVREAQDAGRITNDQEATVVAAYNAAF